MPRTPPLANRVSSSHRLPLLLSVSLTLPPIVAHIPAGLFGPSSCLSPPDCTKRRLRCTSYQVQTDNEAGLQTCNPSPPRQLHLSNRQCHRLHKTLRTDGSSLHSAFTHNPAWLTASRFVALITVASLTQQKESACSRA
ncbi:hypothetical protein LZ32DRAFT_327542 [Colletotrichum eremochloae]|nr:hypothetical protein LZ32DRAFT_327542 [Colletotrichum eremochloae]